MAREGLAKGDRIRSSADFREVFEKGRAYSGERLVLICLRRGDCGRAVGFATTRRMRKAVVRNRAKRLMREAYRRMKSGIESEGLQLVFMARGDGRGMDFENVRAEMLDLVSKARIWRG